MAVDAHGHNIPNPEVDPPSQATWTNLSSTIRDVQHVSSATARNALTALYEGKVIWRTDVDRFEVYRGGSWDDGAWTSFSPGYSNWTPGNGTWVARYRVDPFSPKTCHLAVQFQAGSTTAFTGSAAVIGVPLPARSVTPAHIGTASLFDASAGSSATRLASVQLETTGGVVLATDGSGIVTATVPFTWASGDSLRFYATYELA